VVALKGPVVKKWCSYCCLAVEARVRVLWPGFLAMFGLAGTVSTVLPSLFISAWLYMPRSCRKLRPCPPDLSPATQRASQWMLQSHERVCSFRDCTSFAVFHVFRPVFCLFRPSIAMSFACLSVSLPAFHVFHPSIVSFAVFRVIERTPSPAAHALIAK